MNNEVTKDCDVALSVDLLNAMAGLEAVRVVARSQGV
jgi:hypothetical protein